MLQSLFCIQPLVGVIGTELSDEVNAATGGVFHERSYATTSGVREVELHVSRLATEG